MVVTVADDDDVVVISVTVLAVAATIPMKKFLMIFYFEYVRNKNLFAKKMRITIKLDLFFFE